MIDAGCGQNGGELFPKPCSWYLGTNSFLGCLDLFPALELLIAPEPFQIALQPGFGLGWALAVWNLGHNAMLGFVAGITKAGEVIQGGIRPVARIGVMMGLKLPARPTFAAAEACIDFAFQTDPLPERCLKEFVVTSGEPFLANLVGEWRCHFALDDGSELGGDQEKSDTILK